MSTNNCISIEGIIISSPNYKIFGITIICDRVMISIPIACHNFRSIEINIANHQYCS